MPACAMTRIRGHFLASGRGGSVSRPANPKQAGLAILITRSDPPEADHDTGVDQHQEETTERTELPWNPSKTLEQLGGDQKLLQEVIDIFLEEAPKHLEALHVAVAQGVAETVETAAHTLKGELGYLGLPEVSQRASQIEEMGRLNNIEGASALLSQFEADVHGLITAIRAAKTLDQGRVRA
jgi:HPt (histidine-containing phosphotransfer) domain-containing protein